MTVGREGAPHAALAWPGAAEPAPRLPLILLYHSISDPSRDPWGVRVSPSRFAEHMRILKERCTPMRLRDLDVALQSGDLPPRTVVVTFDDGYVDNLLTAKPAMERLGVPGTVFVASGYVGSDQEYWWDDLDRLLLQRGRLPREVSLSIGEQRMHWQLGSDAWLHWARWRWQQRQRFYAYEHEDAKIAMHTPRQRMYCDLWSAMRAAPSVAARENALRELRRACKPVLKPRPSCRCCTQAQLRDLAAGGLIEIGAHSVHHPSLGHLGIDEQRREIFESKQSLESIVQQPIEGFAYPFGEHVDFSAETIRLLQQAGYRRACINSNPRTPATRSVDRYQYPRHIVGDWDGARFIAKLAEWFAKFGHEKA